MALQDKLQRFKKEIVPESDGDYQPSASKVGLNNRELWKSLGAEPFVFEGQCVWVREVSYPLKTRHGKYGFCDLIDSVSAWNQENAHHPLSARGLSARDLLFFDTETTGLGGGVGNTIFLIGCGRVLENRVVVRQYFLPSPADEVALYQKFLGDVGELKNLVTYNGKAFDWPQIRTRHTFLRDAVPKLPAFGHFDLLHASRRLWKESLESVRLSAVEEEILRIRRGQDTPGHLVPIYYFQYVKEQDPGIIRGVLEHNESDILSLITLYTHLSDLILSRISATANEQFQLGRWFEYIGRNDAALTFYERACVGQTSVASKAKEHQATIFKQQKQYREALGIWEQLATNREVNKPGIYIEMAKIYEHQYKDFQKALACTKEAHQIIRKRKSMRFFVSGIEEEILKRMQRLRRKLGID